MASFNDIGLGIPQIPLQETATKKTIKTETESGYVRSRARSVRSFKQFSMNYNNLTNTQYQSLMTFFDANQGESFTWTHPITTTVYNVMFNSDDIQANIQEKGRIEVNIQLREVW